MQILFLRIQGVLLLIPLKEEDTVLEMVLVEKVVHLVDLEKINLHLLLLYKEMLHLLQDMVLLVVIHQELIVM